MSPSSLMSRAPLARAVSSMAGTCGTELVRQCGGAASSGALLPAALSSTRRSAGFSRVYSRHVRQILMICSSGGRSSGTRRM